MRIVFLNTTSMTSPYTRGRCWPFARALAMRGHEVHIVTLHHDMPEQRPFTIHREGICIHYVGQMHVRKSGDTTTYFTLPELIRVVATGTWNMMRYALMLKGDIYHLGKPHPQNSVVAFILKSLRRASVVLDYDDIEHVANAFQAGWQRMIARWLEMVVPRFVDGVTYHAKILGMYLSSLGLPSDRCLRLPSIVERERFAQVPDRVVRQWKQRFSLPLDTPIIAYIGTMSLVNHPVDLLLESFALLIRRGIKAHLLLVGGGPDLTTLRQTAIGLGIDGQCTFVGRVGADEVPFLLHTARLSVDPVRNDLVARARWPLKIIESLAAGVPVVTGDVGDRRELLADGRAGILVMPGNVVALADGLEKGLCDEAYWRALQRATHDAWIHFDEELHVGNLLAFYESLRQ